jgi:hypothetical protein
MASNIVFASGTVATSTQTETGGGTVTLKEDALIVTSAGAGLDLSHDVWKVTVNGLIDGASVGLAIDVGGAGKSTLTIGTEGIIRTEDNAAAALDLHSAADVTNAGDILGGAAGIAIDDLAAATGKGFTITNAATGTISGTVGITDIASGQILTLKNLGTIAGQFHAVEWDGAALITNSGTMQGDLVQTTAGATTITNSGMIDGAITLEDGVNKLTNSGTIHDAVTSSGGATTLSNTGELFSVALGGGADTFTNSGKGHVADTVDLGDGANKLTNSGTIDGAVTLGGDNDTLVNTNFIYDDVDLGNGDNKVTNSGVILGDLTGGTGKDVIGNTKLIAGDVALGEGDNTLTNSGTISGNVTSGFFHDVFTNTGMVSGTINLGNGDDVFTGGNSVDQVIDAAGNDTYNLGGGNDQVVLVSGNDKLDGGAGIDTLSLTGITTAATINLDTKGITINNQVLAANSVTTAGIADSAKNFENAVGGDGDDIIAGNAAANALSGGAGADTVYGGLGADSLSGNGGSDTFLYLSVKDSGNTKATRDTITDFSAGDKIDLSAFDADTTKAGVDHFTFLTTVNAAFTAAGQLRFIFDGTNTIVQGDVNGDGRADIAIALVGSHTLTAGDFTL